MRKSDGSYTYFVPDVAYHLAKFERGFAKAINIQGTDHHGTIARVRAGLQAAGVGVPPATPTTCSTPWCGRARRRGSQDLQARRQLRDPARPDRLDQQRRGALLHAEQEGRHRVHLRRRPRAEAERREPGLLRPVRARPHLLGARSSTRPQGGDAGRRWPASRPGAAGRAERDRAAEQARRLPADARRRRRDASRRTRSRSTCASWRRRFHSYYAAERFLVDDRRARARAPGPARGDAPDHPQRARRPRRRRARAHARETETGMKHTVRPPPARRLPDRLRRRPADRPGGRARRRALRHQGAESVRQQGAGALADAGRRRGRAQPQLGSEQRARRPQPGAGRARRASSAAPRRPTVRRPPPAVDRPAAAIRAAPARAARRRPARRAARSRRRRAAPASQLRPRTPAATVHVLRPSWRLLRSEDAEQQRAKLAMLGIESRLTEREQGGRMVYRVRVGPFERREDAEAPRSASAIRASTPHSSPCRSERRRTFAPSVRSPRDSAPDPTLQRHDLCPAATSPPPARRRRWAAPLAPSRSRRPHPSKACTTFASPSRRRRRAAARSR